MKRPANSPITLRLLAPLPNRTDGVPFNAAQPSKLNVVGSNPIARFYSPFRAALLHVALFLH